MSNELTVTTPQHNEVAVFSSNGFENAQRMAKALASSDIVPQTYKGNLANCLVALEVSQRTGSSVLAVMQNLHVIHGRPSWSATYIIAAINSCGRFSPLRFVISGVGDAKSCFAWTTDRQNERLEGPPVSITMAKSEGWFNKNGSKWQTMPELMLRYRAAAFFGRLYAPEILMGMQSDDEMREVIEVGPASEKTDKISEINRKLKKKPQEAPAAELAVPSAASPEVLPDSGTESEFNGETI